MKNNSIQELKKLARVYANICVENYPSELDHWERVWEWCQLVINSTDSRLQSIKMQISQHWLIPGTSCQIEQEF